MNPGVSNAAEAPNLPTLPTKTLTGNGVVCHSHGAFTAWMTMTGVLIILGVWTALEKTLHILFFHAGDFFD